MITDHKVSRSIQKVSPKFISQRMQEGPFMKKMCTKRKLLSNFPRSDPHLLFKDP